MNTAAGLLALFASAACGAAPTVPLQAFNKSGDESDARFCTTAGTARIEVEADGRLRLNERTVGRLPLWKNDTLDWIWWAPLRQDILMAYEVTNRTEDASAAAICRLSNNLSSRKWCTQFPGFNLVATKSAKGTLLLSGIGTVAELDPETGKYLWKITGLYKLSKAFGSFLTPVEEGAVVEFHSPANTQGSKTWVAKVNRQTGKLLGVAEARENNSQVSEIIRKGGECER